MAIVVRVDQANDITPKYTLHIDCGGGVGAIDCVGIELSHWLVLNNFEKETELTVGSRSK